jgi:hypothetical protein
MDPKMFMDDDTAAMLDPASYQHLPPVAYPRAARIVGALAKAGWAHCTARIHLPGGEPAASTAGVTLRVGWHLWAVGYNTIAFPLAAGVFYPFTLSPEIAALSMSGSSAIVAINALMLKRIKLTGIKSPSARPPDAGLTAAPAQAD